MSDPTLTIRLRYKQDGQAAVQRTVDVAVRPRLSIADLAERSARRVENAILDLFEDMGATPITADPEITVEEAVAAIHSPSNAITD